MKKFFCVQFKTSLNKNLEIAHKQTYWRIRNLGQLELEIIIQKWFEQNKNKLSFEELEEFSKEVLEMENPLQNHYFINLHEAPEDLKYTNIIQKELFH